MQSLTTLHIMLHHVKFVISPNSSDSSENSLCLITDILCIDFNVVNQPKLPNRLQINYI